MALFKVNTGLRQAEVAQLRWEWEVEIPELGTSIFVIPREYTKLELDRYVVLNRIARSIIEGCRGKHKEVVFTYGGNPIDKIYNSGWKSARRRAALRYEKELNRPCPTGFRSIRVHDLKHTFGHRLRGAGVSFEDRKVLLGHKTQDVTTHYSAAEIGLLIAATERVCDLTSRGSPAVAVVRSRQSEGVTKHMPPTDQSDETTAKTDERTYLRILPISLKKAAAELAKADGVSLDQFIAAAVAEKVGSLRASIVDSMREPQLAATARRSTGAIAFSPQMGSDPLTLDEHVSHRRRYEALEPGSEAGDPGPGWSDSRYWRWPSVTPPKVPRAEIIKRRSSKFPWVERRSEI
jgi:hypothetical protein